MGYRVLFDPRAVNDIREAMAYYDNTVDGLGSKFLSAFYSSVRTLEMSPLFSIRYDKVRCLPIKRFPYMIHFTVDIPSATVTVRAVFHTSQDPDNLKSGK